jgi:hypothetical protein
MKPQSLAQHPARLSRQVRILGAAQRYRGQSGGRQGWSSTGVELEGEPARARGGEGKQADRRLAALLPSPELGIN